jgi:hypothetical protein
MCWTRNVAASAELALCYQPSWGNVGVPIVKTLKGIFMLNVIALRPARGKPPENKIASRPASLIRHHVLKTSGTENSGRLYCEDENDTEVPPLDIYAGR